MPCITVHELTKVNIDRRRLQEDSRWRRNLERLVGNPEGQPETFFYVRLFEKREKSRPVVRFQRLDPESVHLHLSR